MWRDDRRRQVGAGYIVAIELLAATLVGALNTRSGVNRTETVSNATRASLAARHFADSRSVFNSVATRGFSPAASRLHVIRA
jgi:hypothetical protein